MTITISFHQHITSRIENILSVENVELSSVYFWHSVVKLFRFSKKKNKQKPTINCPVNKVV